MSETQETKTVKTIPFYPDHVKTEAKVALGLFLIVIVIGIIAFFNPVGLEEPADPMVTPDHVKPEWYFLAVYQVLKFIPKAVGSLSLVVAILVLFVWPFIDRTPDTKKMLRIRFIGMAIFMIILVAMTLWGAYS